MKKYIVQQTLLEVTDSKNATGTTTLLKEVLYEKENFFNEEEEALDFMRVDA